jgi:hypothetical protein
MREEGFTVLGGIMKRIIILTIICLSFCVAGVFADDELVSFQNHCWTCSYISIEITGNNYSKYINLGGMSSSIIVNIPAGNYNLYAICESGASKGFEWNYQIQIDFINIFDFFCPPFFTQYNNLNNRQCYVNNFNYNRWLRNNKSYDDQRP